MRGYFHSTRTDSGLNFAPESSHSRSCFYSPQSSLSSLPIRLHVLYPSTPKPHRKNVLKEVLSDYGCVGYLAFDGCSVLLHPLDGHAHTVCNLLVGHGSPRSPVSVSSGLDKLFLSLATLHGRTRRTVGLTRLKSLI